MHPSKSRNALISSYAHQRHRAPEDRSLEMSTSNLEIAKEHSAGRTEDYHPLEAEKELLTITTTKRRRHETSEDTVLFLQYTGQHRTLLTDKEGFVAVGVAQGAALKNIEGFWKAWRLQNSTIVHSLSDIYAEGEEIAWICARFITTEFKHNVTSDFLPATSTNNPFSRLKNQIHYVLLRTQREKPIAYGALILLQRVCDRKSTFSHPFPEIANFGLFLCAYIISERFLVDDGYSMSSWVIASGKVFCFEEIGQMQSRMLAFLEWDVAFTAVDLLAMDLEVKKKFI